MKVGDFVDIPTGYGNDRCQGILIGIRDNPADVRKYNVDKVVLPHQELKEPRKIVDVFTNGEIITAWKHHVEVINECR